MTRRLSKVKIFSIVLVVVSLSLLSFKQVSPPYRSEKKPTFIELDKAVLTGKLENGLSYYFLENDSPGKNLELRLVVSVGSLEQMQEEDGAAHFLEHMAFNGTTKYPANELARKLQSLGVEFGTDFNAYTSCEATVYQLRVDSSDPQAVETSFDILDQWAEAVTLKTEDVLSEIGVVLDEYRRKSTIDGVIVQKFDQIYTQGSIYEDCDPIGEFDAIENMESDTLKKFYEHWYRPDLMAVIGVGDLSVEKMFEHFEIKFSDNHSDFEAFSPLVRTASLLENTVIEVIADWRVSKPFISLDFSIPTSERGTLEGEREIFLDLLISQLLQEHLDEQIALGNLSIIRPYVTTFDYQSVLSFLGFNFVSENEIRALEELLRELKGLATHGFESNTVERKLKNYRALLNQRLLEVASIQDKELVVDLVEHYLFGGAADSPKDQIERLIKFTESIEASELSRRFSELIKKSGPLVMVVGDDLESLPTRAEIQSTIGRAFEKIPIKRSNPKYGSIEKLVDHPWAPVRPSAVNELPEINATEWIFPNGTRVIFAYSQIAAGQVDLWAESRGGHSLMRAGDSALTKGIVRAVDDSGVGVFDEFQVSEFKEANGIVLNSYIDETKEGFFGSARASSLESLFSLLYMRITEPRVDSSGFKNAIENLKTIERLSRKDTDMTALVEAWNVRSYENPNLRLVPTVKEITELSADLLLEKYEERLGKVDDLVIAVVGDTRRETVEDLARRYVGTLAPGPSDISVNHWPEAISGVSVRTVETKSKEADAGFDIWVMNTSEVDEEGRAALSVLEVILRKRLIDKLREEMGFSYIGGEVNFKIIEEPESAVDIRIRVIGDPKKITELHQETISEIEKLSVGGFTQEEFASAKKIILKDLDFVRNQDILERLVAWGRSDGQDKTSLSDRRIEISLLTREKTVDFSRIFLNIDNRIEVFRYPE